MYSVSALRDAAPYANVRFYIRLKDRFGKQGEDCWKTGFHLYCFRKGIRAAARSISKGMDLNYENYQLTREAVAWSPEIRHTARDAGPDTSDRAIRPSEREIYDGLSVSRIYYCETVDAFRRYGAPSEMEEYWCRNVDRMMLYNYSPELGSHYEVTETFCTSDHCEHHCQLWEISPDHPMARRTEDAPSLAYLTWSAYSSLAEMARIIFGKEGEDISSQVKQDMIDEFGPDLWKEIEQYKDCNLLQYR